MNKLSKYSKFLIATPMWKRPEVFKTFVKNNEQFCDILAVGSEGRVSRKLAEGLGCIYLEAPNKPLGEKLNYRTRWFLDNDDYSHIILLGSDDIISAKVMEAIYKNSKRYDLISWKDIYFYDIVKNEGYYCAGYKNHRRGEPFAPGRCLSKSLVRKLGPDLWPSGLLKHPDGKLWAKKLAKVKRQKILSCKEIGGYIVDIKSGLNISSFEIMKTTTKTFALNKTEERDIKLMLGV